MPTQARQAMERDEPSVVHKPKVSFCARGPRMVTNQQCMQAAMCVLQGPSQHSHIQRKAGRANGTKIHILYTLPASLLPAEPLMLLWVPASVTAASLLLQGRQELLYAVSKRCLPAAQHGAAQDSAAGGVRVVKHSVCGNHTDSCRWLHFETDSTESHVLLVCGMSAAYLCKERAPVGMWSPGTQSDTGRPTRS
jgi:hypothetical protein